MSLLRVHYEIDRPPGDLLRLTPGGRGEWGGCRFEVNPPDGAECDFLVTLGSVRARTRVRCARENTLLIVAEPPAKKVYGAGYYAQFRHVVDSHALSRHPRLEVNGLGLPWHVGMSRATGGYVLGYDELLALRAPEQRENRVAVVCSNTATTPGQRARLAFLAALKERLGDAVVHFGRGFTPINDKLDGILPYRFQLVLENSCSDNYWTEKLADAYLGWAFPLYVGCPNLERFFPREAFRALDVERPDEAAGIIRALLADAAGEAARRAAVERARLAVLNTYNPFAWAAERVRAHYQAGAAAEHWTLRSHKAFRPFPRGLLFRLRQWGAG